MNENEKAALRGMKEGVAIRIAGLEAKVERLRFALEYATEMVASKTKIQAYCRKAAEAAKGE